jgi:hypothetical protein
MRGGMPTIGGAAFCSFKIVSIWEGEARDRYRIAVASQQSCGCNGERVNCQARLVANLHSTHSDRIGIGKPGLARAIQYVPVAS